MKFFRSDIPLMRWSLAMIFTSALLSSIMLYSSSQYSNKKEMDLRTAQQALNNARNRLTAARQDQENLSAYSAEYAMLEKQNIIGDDHRLDWMEGLEKLRLQHLVPDFRYNIAPQKIYTPQPAMDSGNFDIHYSEMKLQFDLLHEGQLLNFFDAVHRQIKGRYQLAGCTLQQIDENKTAPVATHIKAECSGGWVTLKNRSTAQ